MVYCVDWREADVTALDTSTPLINKGADAPGGFTVPNAAAITEILISVGADWTADTLEGFTSAIRLTGPGLGAPESWIGGPVGMVGGVATTSAALQLGIPQRILCNIPVKPGMLINAYGFMHGSADPGSLRINVSLVYDGPVRGNAKYFDYREGDTAAANTAITLANRGGVAENDFQVGPGTICDVIIGVGGVPVAGPLSATTVHVLSGTGLAQDGPLEFLGNSISVQDDITASGASEIIPGLGYKSAIKTKTGLIRVQAQEVEDDVGTPSHIITFGFQ